MLGVGLIVLGLGGLAIFRAKTEPTGTAQRSSNAVGAGHQHADAASELGGHTHHTRLEFRTQPAEIVAGVPTIWTLKVFNANTDKPVREFDVVHDKLLHLIVVSKDLSWFNHIHPDYRDRGLFIIRPTVPRAGLYKLYADYTPKGGANEVAQEEFSVEGANRLPLTPSLVPDRMKDGWMTKRVTAKSPDDDPDPRTGASYEVALMPMPAKLVAGQDAMLHFQVRDAQGKPITDLEPYMGAMGHAVILSQDSNIYLHTHPLEGGMEGMAHGATSGMAMPGMAQQTAAVPQSTGPDVVFHTKFPKPGLYKAWGQFLHKGLVVAAPFVLNVAAGPRQPAAAKTRTPSAGAKQAAYHCPMHPEVTSDNPAATCARCGGMKLVKRT